MHPTLVDGGLLMAVASENLASGMGTAAFLAFLMSLTNQRFSATQFALLSAFQSVGRVWIGPLAGVLAEAIGWPAFFLVAIVMGVPSLIWLQALVAAHRCAGRAMKPPELLESRAIAITCCRDRLQRLSP